MVPTWGGGILESNLGEFKKFNKNKKQKKILIGSIIGILFVLGGITLYRTFAFYEEKKEFNVLQGKIPDVEMKLIALINDNPVESIPLKGKGYTVNKVECDNGVKASWDKNTWSLTNITNPNKVIKKICRVNFVPIPNKTYKVEALCNNNAAEMWQRVQSVSQTIDTSEYSVLKVSTSYNHWVIYNAESTYSASISPVGYSTSWSTNRGGIAGTIPNSTKTYDISNINSIKVKATSGAYGNTTVNITLTN